MPTKINDMIDYFGLQESEKVRWNERIRTEKEGIYIVSTSETPDSNSRLFDKMPISNEIINRWINKVNGFELDGKLTFDNVKIIERLSQFWLPDENILYIGKAPIRRNGKGLGNRVNEFYKTNYGDRRPHAGGHWLKALEVLNDLYIHYVLCNNSGEIEIDMLEYFINNVSIKSKAILRDKDLMLPYGNLELRKGQIKKHGLRGMKK